MRISTGEGWNNVMFDVKKTPSDGCIPNKTCGSSVAPIFFVAFLMICTFVMLNLFVLIIIQQFETYYLPDDNILKNFKNDLDIFKVNWTAFTKEHNCLKVLFLGIYNLFRFQM